MDFDEAMHGIILPDLPQGRPAKVRVVVQLRDPLEEHFENLQFGIPTSAPAEEPGAPTATGEPLIKRAGASVLRATPGAKVRNPKSGWTFEYDKHGELFRAYAEGVQPEIVFTR